MRINRESYAGSIAVIYLDGRELRYCMEADDSEGVAWAMRIREDGQAVHADDAVPGDFIMDNVVVERLTGRVEVRFDLSKTDIPEEDLRRLTVESFRPFSIYQVVQ